MRKRLAEFAEEDRREGRQAAHALDDPGEGPGRHHPRRLVPTFRTHVRQSRLQRVVGST